MKAFLQDIWTKIASGSDARSPINNSSPDDTALLRLLVAVAEDLSQATVDEILHSLINRLQAYYRADHACIHFAEPDELRDETLKVGLVACPVHEAPPDERETMAQIEATFQRLAMQQGKSISASTAQQQIDGWERLTQTTGIADGTAIPLIHQSEIFGTVNLYFSTPKPIDPLDVSALGTLGNLAYGAIQKELRLQSLREHEDVIAALATAVEAKDALTGGHVGRVKRLAGTLGEAAGLSRWERRILRRAAILHDVGKIGVPEAILNKPDKLTPDEFAVIRQHPEIGARILSHLEAPGMEKIIAAVRGHHERWSGSGYPDGLAGEDIPLMARTIAVADTYDALTNDRPYRSAFSRGRALEILVESCGEHLDKRLVDLFLEERVYEQV